MNEQTLKLLAKVSGEFRFGEVVWHRSNGTRGIVVGYKICCDGGVLVSVTWGGAQDDNYPIELSLKKVSKDDDGDEWKETSR